MVDETQLERRILILRVLIAIVLFLLFARLVDLQLVNGDEYARRAEGNRIRLMRTGAPRGLLYDRFGRVLVSNRTSFAVVAWPEGLPRDSERVLNELAGILKIPADRLKEALAKGAGSPVPIVLERDVDPQAVIAIEERRDELPGVFIMDMPTRSYPYGSLGAHVFGYLGPIDLDELKRWRGQGYVGTDQVGKTGIERLYERDLRGVPGGQQVEVDASLKPVQVLGELPATPGTSLVLTIDLDLQKAAEEALSKSISRLDRRRPGVRHAGSVVVLDLRSGAILALASQPAYDPNRLTNGPDRGAYFTSLLGPPSALLNRALSGIYPPGSVFKPVTAIAALMKGVVKPEDRYYADGYGPYGKVDWNIQAHKAPHGWVDMYRAFAVSSNDYFWHLGELVGVDDLSYYARLLGFGAPTGLDFYPEEKTGTVPDREYKRSLFQDRPLAYQIWYPAETLDFAIGQGFMTATPLQVAQLYMLIANRGVAFRPYLVAGKVSPQGEWLEHTEPVVGRQVDLPREVWETVERGLQKVVQPGGTAYGAFIGVKYPVAGKTGTAELSNGPSHGWFAAYAPVGDPEVVVVAMVEHGEGGASAAAPIARAVLDAYFAARSRPPALPAWWQTGLQDGRKGARAVENPSVGPQASPDEHGR
ncbi:MAG TPA: penicillin-binding protein 2 [Firmicutes bacterium]|nr:penicillin-binding protein 2 [Bacillota bacterium]